MMNTAQRKAHPKISKSVLKRTVRFTIARASSVSNPQFSSITVADAYTSKLLDSPDPYQSVYVSENEMLIGLKKSHDPHYPYRAIVYTDSGQWMLDVPLSASAQLSVIR